MVNDRDLWQLTSTNRFWGVMIRSQYLGIDGKAFLNAANNYTTNGEIEDSAAGGMNLKVTGGANFIRSGGVSYQLTTNLELSVAASDADDDRYDLIVARYDSGNTRYDPAAITGLASEYPHPPKPVDHATHPDIPMAVISIPEDLTELTVAHVTDVRCFIAS